MRTARQYRARNDTSDVHRNHVRPFTLEKQWLASGSGPCSAAGSAMGAAVRRTVESQGHIRHDLPSDAPERMPGRVGTRRRVPTDAQPLRGVQKTRHILSHQDQHPRVRMRLRGSHTPPSRSAPSGTRTHTEPILSRVPLPIGLWGRRPALAGPVAMIPRPPADHPISIRNEAHIQLSDSLLTFMPNLGTITRLLRRLVAITAA